LLAFIASNATAREPYREREQVIISQDRAQLVREDVNPERLGPLAAVPAIKAATDTTTAAALLLLMGRNAKACARRVVYG
jgi:hypothetical protein